MDKFKVGDKVRITGNTNCSNNMVGDIGVITEKHTSSLDNCWKVSVKGRLQYGNFTKEYDMKLVETVEYENEWCLNDGKVTIPDDADKLEKDGSVVAFRKRKPKPFEFGEKLRIKKSLWLGLAIVEKVNPGLDYVDAVYLSEYFDVYGNEGIKVYIANGAKGWECCLTDLNVVERLG